MSEQSLIGYWPPFKANRNQGRSNMKPRYRCLLRGALLSLGITLPPFVSGGPSMNLTSSAFAHLGAIPGTYTCEGRDISPPLAWGGLPEGTQSLVLIVDDPDAPDPSAPKMTWVHWVLYNIPATAAGLPEGVTSETIPAGTREGLNDWKRRGYGGPCPPIGRHRYFHKLYALDTLLPDLGPASKAQVEQAMSGHILEQAELTGTYQKHGSP
jgi:Raf kinase inhibitor-like YbhB/YbcL family protein